MIDKKHIEKEKNRSIDNLNRVFLYKDENSGWYRAHEWSAYLVEFYNRNIDKKDRLKPIHKMFTENESVISVGLQIKSFDKFLPDLDIEFKENYAEFLVNLNSYEENITFNNFLQLLKSWKESVPKKENKQNSQQPKSIQSCSYTLLSVFKDILKYDTYGKSENELRKYIQELKEKCASIIC